MTVNEERKNVKNVDLKFVFQAPLTGSLKTPLNGVNCTKVVNKDGVIFCNYFDTNIDPINDPFYRNSRVYERYEHNCDIHNVLKNVCNPRLLLSLKMLYIMHQL